MTMSRWRYAELRAFCRQYGEKKKLAQALLGGAAQRLDGLPRPSGPCDPVPQAAARRERLIRDCAAIEAAAASLGAWRWALMQNVCFGLPYEHIPPALLPTSNRNAFFRARRIFFDRLRENLEI